MHIPAHQQQLRDAAALAPRDWSRAIDAVIERMRRENPGAFHTDDTLRHRRFVHAPLHDIPHAGFLTTARVA